MHQESVLPLRCTLGNGRVETRTVTRREGGAAAAATTAITVTKPNVAHYTEVRGGTTYVHTVEIQRRMEHSNMW